MNSAPSKSENNIDTLYKRNKIKSVSFLAVLAVVLLIYLGVLFDTQVIHHEE